MQPGHLDNNNNSPETAFLITLPHVQGNDPQDETSAFSIKLDSDEVLAVEHEAGALSSTSTHASSIQTATQDISMTPDLPQAPSMSAARGLPRVWAPNEGYEKDALPQVRTESKYKLLTRNLAAFLGDFPDDRPLSDFLLPGTHDTLAYYGYPFSQCQSPTFPLEAQLLNGVRVLDIRLAVSANPDGSGLELIGYHGIISQRVSFVTVLAVVKDFLRANPTECVVMSIKREQNLSKTPTILFSQLVKKAVYAERELWFLDNRIPRLGEVRGKIILFSRFSDFDAPFHDTPSDPGPTVARLTSTTNVTGSIKTSNTGATDVVGGWPGGEHSGMGIHPTTWPDSYRGVFEWMCAGVSVYMQDWYAVPSFLAIPEKFELATAPLIVERQEPENLLGLNTVSRRTPNITVPDAPTRPPPYSPIPGHSSSSQSESQTSTFPWPFPPSKPPIPSLTMTYTSASSIPFALPPMIALGFGIWWGGWRWGGFGWRGVNERVRDWVLQVLEGDKDEDQVQAREYGREGDLEKGYIPLGQNDNEKVQESERATKTVIRGWIMMDYVDIPGDLLPLLVECNYH